MDALSFNVFSLYRKFIEKILRVQKNSSYNSCVIIIQLIHLKSIKTGVFTKKVKKIHINNSEGKNIKKMKAILVLFVLVFSTFRDVVLGNIFDGHFSRDWIVWCIDSSDI